MKLVRTISLALGLLVLVAAGVMYTSGAPTAPKSPDETAAVLGVETDPEGLATVGEAVAIPTSKKSAMKTILRWFTGGSDKEVKTTVQTAEREPAEVRVLRGGNALNGRHGSGRLVKARVAEE